MFVSRKMLLSIIAAVLFFGVIGYSLLLTKDKIGGPAEAQSVSANEADLLARLIAAEAQGEPYEGQVAVGAVILNRVKDPQFPNSLSGVMHQPHAFESVTNGLVWQRSPDDSAIRAARDAMNGWDPTQGCLFFWNPSKPISSKWIWSRTVVRRIGSHVFAR
ncbi:MAG: spore cortex-lytic protein [Firmicutes bacterium]|nr:spore cortex-lytic protein [Bacillota bacterium]